MTGNNTKPTMIVDKNGKLTTVHKNLDGSTVGTSQPSRSSKVRHAPLNTDHYQEQYVPSSIVNSNNLEDIVELQNEITTKAVSGLITAVQVDYPEARQIVLESDNSDGKYFVQYINNGGGEPLGFDAGDIGVYDLFAAHIDVESSLVNTTEYGDRYTIDWDVEE